VPFVRQRAERDCGAAALAMVLRYWGVPIDVDHLAAEFPTAAGKGLKAIELRDMARARGLDAFLIKGDPADLRAAIEQRRPLVVGMAQPAGGAAIGHYEVVVGVDHDHRRILTLDPAAGWRDSSFDEFATEWAGAQQLALVIFRRAR
jgi:ABC-type bacteriocin/lantibiotic exporter with double-glycine peptidase domain